MDENWKDIAGYKGLYQISDYGRVRSVSRKVRKKHGFRTVNSRILKATDNGGGYLAVGLSKHCKVKNFLVHRLVALHFLDNTDKYKEVNHIDGCKQNNTRDNLEWCSRQQNITHSIETKLTDQNGEKHHSTKLTQDEVNKIREEYACGDTSYSKLGTKYNATLFTIRNIVKGYTWKQSFSTKR